MTEAPFPLTPEAEPSRLKGTLLAGATAVAAEHGTDEVDWSGYLDKVRTVLAPLNDDTGRVDMRIVNPYHDEIPTVLVNSPDGVTNISHLLQPGSTVVRRRPEDEDGDMTFTVDKAPFLVSAGSAEPRWRMKLTDGRAKTAIDVTDLVAPPNPTNHRSWRLQIPESLPGDFRPANH